MEVDRFYCAEIHESSKSSRLYFYATVAGSGSREEAGIFHETWVLDEFETCVEEIGQKQAQHVNGTANGSVTSDVPEPLEISREEMIRQNPGVHTLIDNAIRQATERIGRAVHPIKLIWYWETFDRRPLASDRFVKGQPQSIVPNGTVDDADFVVSLRIADDTPAVFSTNFTTDLLAKRFWTGMQISKVYDDLLRYRSHRQLEDIITTSALCSEED